MLVGWLLKGCLLVVSVVLIIQWVLMITKVDYSRQVFSLNFDSAAGHNMFLADLGGLILGVALMTIAFVFHSMLWMYPLMLLSITVLIGRFISFAQRGRSSVGIVGMMMEILGLAILLLFATNLVNY